MCALRGACACGVLRLPAWSRSSSSGLGVALRSRCVVGFVCSGVLGACVGDLVGCHVPVGLYWFLVLSSAPSRVLGGWSGPV